MIWSILCGFYDISCWRLNFLMRFAWFEQYQPFLKPSKSRWIWFKIKTIWSIHLFYIKCNSKLNLNSFSEIQIQQKLVHVRLLLVHIISVTFDEKLLFITFEKHLLLFQKHIAWWQQQKGDFHIGFPFVQNGSFLMDCYKNCCQIKKVTVYWNVLKCKVWPYTIPASFEKSWVC